MQHVPVTIVVYSNRQMRKDRVKEKNAKQAELNRHRFTYKQTLNKRLAAGEITPSQYRNSVPPATKYQPKPFLGVHVEVTGKKVGDPKLSLVNLRSCAKTGARNASEVNRKARIERKRKWDLMQAEVKQQLAA